MRRVLVLAGVALVSVCLSLLALELVYRTQVVDTYGPELRAFNPPEVLTADGRPALLAMGDSFTAGHASYTGILQDRLRDWRVINSGIGGTGILQALYTVRNRFARFRPTVFVYQIYVGNDLFDIRYPVNWHAISPTRNAYWLVANHLRVVGFLNYRLGQVRGTLSPDDASAAHGDPAAEAPFETDRYDARVRTYLRAEPSLFEDSILVRGRRREDYAVLLHGLDELVGYCRPDACRAYLLVVPQVSQVEDEYVAHLSEMGARFTRPVALHRAGYPFVRRLREHFLHRPDVRVLDPLPALRRAAAEGPVYYANDEHLNPHGQRVVADFLVERLGLR